MSNENQTEEVKGNLAAEQSASGEADQSARVEAAGDGSDTPAETLEAEKAAEEKKSEESTETGAAADTAGEEKASSEGDAA